MDKLWLITLGVAAVGGMLSILMLVAPERMKKLLLTFPRHVLTGQVLSALALIWSGWMLYNMPMGMVDAFKPFLLVLTPVVIGLVWYYLDDLLAVRALGGLFLLIPSPWLEAARLHASAWSAVASAFAYIMIIKGMIFVVSPHLFRRMTERWLKHDWLLIMGGAIGVMVHGALIVLALTVYR